MSTSTEPGDGTTGDPFDTSDGDVSALLTRGVVDGFTEASEAFTHELRGTDRVPDLMGRSVAGVIRANARLLDELATVVRQMSDGMSVRARSAAEGNVEAVPLADLDYERLADLVAERLRSAGATGADTPASSGARARKS